MAIWTKNDLFDLLSSEFSDYRFVVVSNREPYVTLGEAAEKSNASGPPAVWPLRSTRFFAHQAVYG